MLSVLLLLLEAARVRIPQLSKCAISFHSPLPTATFLSQAATYHLLSKSRGLMRTLLGHSGWVSISYTNSVSFIPTAGRRAGVELGLGKT